MVIGISVAVLLLVVGIAALLASEGSRQGFRFAAGMVVLAIVAFAAGLYWGPQYSVWQQGMEGKAELTRAEQNRQIKVEEARATFEAAKLNAEAEIERAKGAAKANEIMAESLGGPDRYLRWRWITMLESNDKSGITREIIYVPADGSMPLSEAGRAVSPAAPVLTPNDQPK